MTKPSSKTPRKDDPNAARKRRQREAREAKKQQRQAVRDLAKSPTTALVELPDDAPDVTPQTPAQDNTSGGWTALQDEEHMLFILNLRLRHATTQQIITHCRATYGFGQYRTRNLLQRALEQLKTSSSEEMGFAKYEAAARIKARLREAMTPRIDERTKKAKPLTVQMHGVILRYEDLLADLQGSRAPIEVKVSQVVHVSAMNVLAHMEPARLEAMLERAKARKLAAEMNTIDMLLPAANPGSR